MKFWMHAVLWGLIFVGAALVWMLFERSMGWHGEKIAQHAAMTNGFAVVAIGVFVLALLDKRRRLGNVMTWKQGFRAGIGITLVVALLSPFSQWLTHTVISPDYFANVIDYTVAIGALTREAAEEYFTLGNYIQLSAMGGLVMGTLTSALVALALRRKPANRE